MAKIAFLIDGFNLYHSLKDAQLADKGRQTRWLNVRAMCEFFLPKFLPNSSLGPIHYFSAYAAHRQKSDPDAIARHERYIRCLQDTGVVVEMGGFVRRSDIACTECGRQIPGGWEEKETDVGLGVRLLDLLVQDTCQGAVVVTGDRDQSPAFKTARRLFPKCPVFACFPYARENDVLKAAATKWLSIPKASYRQLQFPNPFVTAAGKVVPMPAEWASLELQAPGAGTPGAPSAAPPPTGPKAP